MIILIIPFMKISKILFWRKFNWINAISRIIGPSETSAVNTMSERELVGQK